jgi:hypothetical protein
VSADMGPDEGMFRAHLESGPFLSGADRGRWRLIEITWPYTVVGVSAAARENGPLEYVFRFECSNYPQSPPTAQPWDLEYGVPLAPARWPGGRSRVPAAFRPDWKGGQCLYLPCDRVSIEGHDAWRTQHPAMNWTSTSDITLYLDILYELLNSSDYTGARGI